MLEVRICLSIPYAYFGAHSLAYLSTDEPIAWYSASNCFNCCSNFKHSLSICLFFTCNFAFEWGSKFENKNPSECYASKSTDSDKATVISNLKAFDDAVKLVEEKPWMSVVVTPVAVAASN